MLLLSAVCQQPQRQLRLPGAGAVTFVLLLLLLHVTKPNMGSVWAVASALLLVLLSGTRLACQLLTYLLRRVLGGLLAAPAVESGGEGAGACLSACHSDLVSRTAH